MQKGKRVGEGNLASERAESPLDIFKRRTVRRVTAVKLTHSLTAALDQLRVVR